MLLVEILKADEFAHSGTSHFNEFISVHEAHVNCDGLPLGINEAECRERIYLVLLRCLYILRLFGIHLQRDELLVK